MGIEAGTAGIGTVAAVDRNQHVTMTVPSEGGVEANDVPSAIAVGEVGIVGDLDKGMVGIGHDESRGEIVLGDIGEIDIHVGEIIALTAVNRVELHSGDGVGHACHLRTVDQRLDIAVVVETVTDGTIAAGGS